jgi:NAD(P)-dependent dehydrogenase (short-subunit alcohol dehydrogenase family)
MRAQRSGVVANLGSIGSWRGVPGAGLYCGTKAACSIHSEALRNEVAHLGIEVTAIEPGYFRTSFLTSGNRKRAEKQISDLAPAVEPCISGLDAKNLHQPGDPIKGAQLIVEALTKTGRCQGRSLPARLALGKDAAVVIPSILDGMREDMGAWSDLTTSTDFDE